MTPPLPPLTKRQRAVVEVIWQRVRKRQPPPSLRDMARHFGWSGPNAARGHYKRLIRKGWIETDFNLGRGVRLTRGARKRLAGIPMLETLAGITKR